MTAQEVADILLEATGQRLMAFGPQLPLTGMFLSSTEKESAFGLFVRSFFRQSPANNAESMAVVNRMIKAGYSFVLRNAQGGFTVYTIDQIDQDRQRTRRLKDLMGLTGDTVVYVSDEMHERGDYPTKRASEVIAGLETGPEKPEEEDDDRGPGQGAQIEMLSFGGAENPPEGTYSRPKRLSSRTLQKGIEAGLKYVLQYPGGKIVFVTPDIGQYKFSPEEIKAITDRFGLETNTPVSWFAGSTRPDAEYQIRAKEVLPDIT